MSVYVNFNCRKFNKYCPVVDCLCLAQISVCNKKPGDKSWYIKLPVCTNLDHLKFHGNFPVVDCRSLHRCLYAENSAGSFPMTDPPGGSSLKLDRLHHIVET